MVDLATLTAAVEAGDRKSAVAITQSAIDEGMAPQADPRRHDEGHGHRGRQVQPQRALRPRDAHQCEGHEGVHGTRRSRADAGMLMEFRRLDGREQGVS